MKKRIAVILCLILITVILQLDKNKVKAENPYKTGLISETEEELSQISQSGIEVYANLPSYIDLSYKFPPAGDQGVQNSCTAWAVGYALKSFQEQDERNWGVNTKYHQFSPSFIYNQINEGVDEGSRISDAMRLIKDKGITTLSDMPYNQYDYWTKPTQSQLNNASKYRAISYFPINGTNISEIKNYLANNIPVILSIQVYNDLYSLNSTYNKVYDSTAGPFSGYHAICLTGYDDSIGAFKFINSWGTSWGTRGYGYLSYNIIPTVSNYGYIMYDSDWVGHWAEKSIKTAMNSRWINDSDRFRPDAPITRAEFIKIVNKAFGFKRKASSESFNDVNSSDWWYSEVLIALGNNYITSKNTNFRPRDPITRQEVANIITSITKTKDSNLDKLQRYSDKHLISESMKSSVEGSIEKGFMGVGSTTFNPQKNITRAEAIETISRVKRSY